MKMKNKYGGNVKELTLMLLFSFLCLGTLFLSSATFVNTQITAKWYCFFWGFSAFILNYVLYSFFLGKIQLRNTISVFCLIITGLCTIQALYGILQCVGIFPAVGGFRITGSFDNPAGFAACLCAGFPFSFYFVRKEYVWQRWLSLTAVVILCIAVILSASRAGIIALFVVALFMVFYRFKIKTKLKISILSLSFVLALSGLYFLKKDSANGRLLIWRCTYEMIKDKPIHGFGYGGFKANYMNYQARYFEEHPDSKYAMLADNVNRPFNEYLLLFVNFGVFGLLVLILMLYRFWQIYKYNTHKTLLEYRAYWCLLSIAVFSLFSYPLTYPFVWVMGLSSMTILFYPLWRTQKKMFYALRPVIILFLLFVGYMTYDRMITEMKWCKIAHKSLAGQTKQMLPEYQSLYGKLQNNELFLYNYAAELNVVNQYEKSLKIAHECEQLWADYDLQMLIADNYQKKLQYKEAEFHYIKAANMCPVKFIPLYLY
ncbi:hypothetical protein EZS27_003669 [termite gut metagenome]|jgi:O-antigen ligase|uniref:O-antigen ligase-related domain-containing protein n=1 Tax=termite gut metagenome TaxID=433724 RepID=A0A5J4SRQ4_9ZZZZ